MKANRKLITNNRGVSPVIGVMLMIVVTVILAAAISSYSASIKSRDVAPQATFNAEVSYSDEKIRLGHLGGDTLFKSNTRIEVAYGQPLISGYVDMDNVTFSPEPDYLRPGDIATIEFEKGDYGAKFVGENIKLSVPIGTPFRLTIIDTSSGQIVYSTKLVMNP